MRQNDSSRTSSEPIRFSEPRRPFRLIRTVGQHQKLFSGDMYHALITCRWRQFFAAILLSLLLINSLFACLYLLQPGSIDSPTGASVHDAFFFSVQTLATIGYGGMVPATTYADILVTIEATLGMLWTAVVTGLTFAKFSRPTAKVLFSRTMVVAPRNGVPHLMFRLANWRHNRIVEARISVAVILEERTSEGETMRRPVPLQLVRERNEVFWMSWTVMHPIDDSSPLFGRGALEQLQTDEVNIVVSLSGIDEDFSQPIHTYHTYRATDVIEGHRFVDILSRPGEGILEIDYNGFHETVPLEGVVPAAG
ncbi:MAG: ion channel [Nannocystaceae bacterium]